MFFDGNCQSVFPGGGSAITSRILTNYITDDNNNYISKNA